MRLSALRWLAAAALLQAPAPAQEPSGFSWPEDLRGRTVLYVGAHPDDEWGVAPLLAQACLERGANCRFIVAADGRSYGCLLTIGLRDPDECSRIRRDEMRAAARLFRGTADFYGWEDLFYAFNEAGLHRTLSGWEEDEGGYDALVERFERSLRETRPVVLFTLDPRHGSTCHPAHRAVAMLVLEAVNRLPAEDRPQVWLEQTDNIDERSPQVAWVNAQTGYIGWPDTALTTIFFDANVLVSGIPAYDYALAARRLHPSQFPVEASAGVAPNPPAPLRMVPISASSALTPGDYCTALHLERPTFEFRENRRRFVIE